MMAMMRILIKKMMPAKTRQQIALEYDICTKTLGKWLKSADLTLPAGAVTPHFQKLIYEKFGSPNYAAGT